jgi:deoxyhypusine synthase
MHAIVEAHRKQRTVVMAMGAHVIKCGLSPLVIDLMERKIISAVAMNSAVAIHDYEVSLVGYTSEDVGTALKDGSFGMAREAAEAVQEAASRGAREGIGFGAALGKKINEDGSEFAGYSILAAADRLNMPATVHVIIGGDTVHMHPNISGSDLGESSLIDFRILAGVVAQLEDGVWLNVGSAVVMPEVFLKCISVARNLGNKVQNFVTADMDMLRHYRPTVNVVQRPHLRKERGYSITGHHEIMLPLLRTGILSLIDQEGAQ